MKRTRFEEWDAEEYNAAFQAREAEHSFDNAIWRSVIVARYILGDSVLDLACGIGQLANMIGDCQYLGVDFSHIQIELAKKRNENPNASFALQNLTRDWHCEKFDTVVLGEIVEHMEDPWPLVQFAINHARRRVISTIAMDIPSSGGHCWYMIERDDVLELFGGEGLPDWALIVHKFLGARGFWRWLVIRDIDGYDRGLQYVERLA